MSAPERWVIASSNAGKLAELKALLESEGLGDVLLIVQTQLGIEAPPETGAAFVENALIKARHAARVRSWGLAPWWKLPHTAATTRWPG